MIAETVLIVTASYDLAPRYVGKALERRGVPFFRFDTDRFPQNVETIFDPKSGLTISDGTQSISANEIRSVWYRRSVPPILPTNLESGTREFCERESRAFVEGTLMAMKTDRWMSPSQAIWLAEKKPYQLAIATELGFTLPRTIVTNDPVRVRDFALHGEIIAKAVSSGYISRTNGNDAIFTSSITDDDLKDLDGLTLAPVTFQEKIEKHSDIRVTVVGTEVFAAEILSQSRETSKIDWRATDDPNLPHLKHQLPAQIADKCRKLVENLGIKFGAIDLALTTEGDYVFFEINPNGEWLWIEDQLGYSIADTIAAWLSESKDCVVC